MDKESELVDKMLKWVYEQMARLNEEQLEEMEKGKNATTDAIRL